MIITLTGKPCSGKGEVTKYLMQKYGFDKFSGGDIFRRIATERGIDVLELNRLHDTSVDKLVDDEIVRIGERDLDKNIIFDSRTAWHFIPKSFKVFLDVSEDEQAKRLLGSGRTNENINLTHEEAKKALNERWEIENKRYKELYDFDNKDQSKFDIVVDTTNLNVEEAAEKIYEAYLKYISK